MKEVAEIIEAAKVANASVEDTSNVTTRAFWDALRAKLDETVGLPKEPPLIKPRQERENPRL